MKLTVLLLLTFAAATAWAKVSPVNTVVYFFHGADRQMETTGQCRELMRALEDALTLKSPELRKKRYANYQGEENKWTIAEIIQRYYLSSFKGNVTGHFYRDYRDPLAQKALRKQLDALGDCGGTAHQDD